MSRFDLSSDIEFAENPEPRCPCVILLDTSQSMEGERIAALERGLVKLKEALVEDLLASLRVEVALVTFASRVKTVHRFTTPDRLELPELRAAGKTHMGSAILHALDLLEARKKEYRDNDIDYYRPWIFLLTDGVPQGEDDSIIEEATEEIRTLEERKSLCFFAIGFGEADMRRLAKISVRPPVALQNLKFEELFLWVSRSMRIAASGNYSQEPLPPPG
ncbi:MAG: VWA domain-containing protein [Planctomycetes bacterium]|nr:VWA domain-containing protein [Planctomycetota bacterium]MCB9872255.1 VWA domain-containing protein [Planctomycetota bacterium]